MCFYNCGMVCFCVVSIIIYIEIIVDVTWTRLVTSVISLKMYPKGKHEFVFKHKILDSSLQHYFFY